MYRQYVYRIAAWSLSLALCALGTTFLLRSGAQNGRRRSTSAPLGLVRVTQLWRINADTSALADLQFSPDGKLLASASHSGSIKLWDTRSWRTVRRWSATSRSVYALAFS